ncbi:extracellular protein, partial [Limosilactobacillus fermentum]
AQTTIVNALITFRDSPISSSKTYVNNVTNTINNVKNSTGDLMNKSKNWANSEAAKTAVKDAQNWFQKLIAWIQNLFN